MADEDAEVVFGVDLGSTQDVIVFATITKDGRVVDCSAVQHLELWIKNLEPFEEE